MPVRTVPLLFAAALLSAAGAARADLSCEELSAQIEAKLLSRGITSFTIGVVPAAAVGSRTVIGSCDNGTRRIVYRRPEFDQAGRDEAGNPLATAPGSATTPAAPDSAPGH